MYNKMKELFVKKQLGWDDPSAVVKVLLVGPGYVPDPDHVFLSDINLATNEVSGNGYTRKTLSGRVVNLSSIDDCIYGDANDITWNGLNCGTVAGAIVYLQVGGDDTTPGDDIILLYQDNADISTNGGDITLQWATNGLFKI